MAKTQQEVAMLVEKLLIFALKNNMIEKWDLFFCRNQLMDLLQIPEPYPEPLDSDNMDIPDTATPILEELLDYAVDQNLIPQDTLTYRDLFDTKIMGILMPRPSEVVHRFENIKDEKGILEATNDFYSLCQKSDYIRVNRIARNQKWEYQSPFGTLEITINLTKPEKDPKEIAALKGAPQVGYPKCLLCPENTGYAGRINHPARQTLRTLPVTLAGEQWYFQYSPYVYYNQHCIVFYEKHVPMKINRKTFERLFDFLNHFPHYFIGSNADLPIVGGSILNHDHFQGGYHIFPMEKAPLEYLLRCKDYPKVTAGVVSWPMSVLRLKCNEPEPLVDLADNILELWRNYSDPAVDILASSTNESGQEVYHNTITPIARINKEGLFELDLVFRNNRASSEHPLGIFHPHSELHHIKKENIGLIEVMGLFILPGRLHKELAAIRGFITGDKLIEKEGLENQDHPLHKHYPWIKELVDSHGNQMDENKADEIIKMAVGQKCLQVLHHAGVFKTSPEGRSAFNRFLDSAGILV